MCQRCIDARIHCPGPVSSAFIFVASGSGANRKEAREWHAQTRGQTASRGLTTSPPLTVSLPPTPTSAILLDTFLRYLSHSARHSSWTFALPSLSAGHTPLTHPLTSALHAVALAHFANTTSDPIFSHHATLEYSRSLSLQRLSLAALPHPIFVYASSRKPQILSAVRYALLSSTILSYYELIAATTPSAWLTHTRACEQLLSLLGPAIVGEDRILRQVSVSVRSHAALRTTIYDHDTVFTQPAWRDGIRMWTRAQQQSVSRDAYDWVIDFMLRLARFYSRQRRRRTNYYSDVEAAIENDDDYDETQAEETPAKFLAELQGNYADWMMTLTSPSPSAPSPPLFGSLPLPRPPPDTPTHLYPPTDLPPPLQAQFPAMALAHFHAAAILLAHHLLQSQLPRDDSCSSTTSYDPAWNCQWIAGACAFLQRSPRTNATAVLRMGLPFAVAWRFCGTPPGSKSSKGRTQGMSTKGRSNTEGGNSDGLNNSGTVTAAEYGRDGDGDGGSGDGNGGRRVGMGKAGEGGQETEGGEGGGEDQDQDQDHQEEEEELPWRQLRMKMRAMFEDWAGKEGMRGLAVVGFPLETT